MARTFVYKKALWEKADPQQIPSFSEQIRLTRNAINDNLLLIEEDHYNKLVLLIAKFEQFKFGKYKLVDIKSEDIDQPISSEDAQKTIRANKKTKDEYDSLIIDIGRSFRNQIKG